MKRDPNLCQLCGKEPWKHFFDGLVPTRIGDRCLAVAHDIRDNGVDERSLTPKPKAKGLHWQTVEGGVVLKTREQREAHNARRSANRPSRARPSRKCEGCDGTIVRIGKRGMIPKWCDGCNPWSNKRTHRVPVVAAGAVA